MAILGNKKAAEDKKPAAPVKAEKKAAVKKPAVKKEETKQAAPENMADLYEDKAKASAKETSVSKFSGAHRVLVQPLITEKAANFGVLNKYAFIVADNANKIEVAKAVKAVYGFKPVAVNIVRVKGKAVTHGRIKGRRSDVKKAIVTLKKGETIQIYEGV
jgi:large subunit ribosomal protein L23